MSTATGARSRRTTIGSSPCRRVLRDLQAYLDGEADADTSWQVARHLSRCPGCFGEGAALRAVQDAVARLRVAADGAALARLRRLLDTLAGPGGAA